MRLAVGCSEIVFACFGRSAYALWSAKRMSLPGLMCAPFRAVGFVSIDLELRGCDVSLFTPANRSKCSVRQRHDSHMMNKPTLLSCACMTV